MGRLATRVFLNGVLLKEFRTKVNGKGQAYRY